MIVPLVTALIAAAPSGDDPVPDPVFFEERILPLVRSTCATSGCHGGSAGAGNLRYTQAGFSGEFDEAQARGNLAASLAFVRPGRPEESLLYLKSIREADGGLPHGGRSYAVAKDSPEARAIADWIRGESLAAVPPIADALAPSSAAPGQRVVLDGSGSRDRRGRPLTFRWEVVTAPEGSRAALEDADRARASFVPDREGTYGLALAVRNGEAEASASLALAVERLPFARFEAESAETGPPFEAIPDASASGGRFLAASREAGSSGTAAWTFEVADDGEYELWMRTRAPAAGAVLSIAVDRAAAFRWSAPAAEGWLFAPAASSSSSKRTAVSGTWEQRDGCLAGDASPGRTALALLDSKVAEGTVDVSLRRGRFDDADGGAFIQIGSREREVAACAGVGANGRFAIGAVARGRVRSLDEGDTAVAGPDGTIAFRVIFDRGRIRLVSGEKVVLERELPAAAAAGMRAGGRRPAPPAAEIGLLVVGGGARFDTVAVRRRGETVFEDRFDGASRGIRLRPGTHRLTLAVEEGSVAIDELLVARAGAGATLPPEQRRFARAAYLDLLKRTPTPVELLAFGADRGGLPARLAGSLEFWQAWYEEELYYFLLLDNFRPATSSLTSLPARLANGSIGVVDAVRELVISQNFNARNPGPDTFVSVVLEQLLGARVQESKETLEAGKRMYDGHPARLFGREGRTQADLVGIVLAHPDFAPTYLGRFHRAIFGAPLDPADPAVERFRRDPAAFPAILREWVGGPAYASALGTPRAKTDPMFVRGLFVDLLGRAPTYREFRNMRNALQALSDSGPVRAVLGRVFVDSGKTPLPRKDAVDADAWIESSFLSLLARRPTDAERESFREAWEDPACTPATILAALVTSREYQCY